MEKVDIINYQEKPLSTEKNTVNKKPNLESIDKTKFKLKKIVLLIIIIAIILGLTSFILWYFLVFKRKKQTKNEEEEKEKENENEKILDNELKNYEKELKAFEPSFKIKSKPDTLTQLLMESSEIFNSKSSGIESSYSIFTKAKYDIYTLNETKSDDENFYETNHTTAIIINSICTEFSLEKKC